MDFSVITKPAIIDSHQHFWTLKRTDYHWLTPDLNILYRDYLPEDFIPFIKENNIVGTVLVQAAETEQETEFLLELSQQYPFILGVIGWIDFKNKNSQETIQQLIKKSYGKFKGLRPMLQDIPDPNWILNPEFHSIWETMQAHNLVLDILIKPLHLPQIMQFLKQYPTLNAVIDHAAKPNIANNEFNQWADQMEFIAENSSVYCKLSGLLTEAKPSATLDDISPYIQHILKIFGTQRVIWGSDWPVLNNASEYSVWLNMVKESIQHYPENAAADIFFNNAKRLYGLNINSEI